MDFIEQLLAELDTATAWPLPREAHAREQVMVGRAIRKGDRHRLKLLAGWDFDRPYLSDPLGKRITFGFADFMFADEPEITAADENDQTELELIVSENDMAARLHRAERTVVSEGEAWWKLHVNAAVSAVPQLTWCSRLDVVPIFYGDLAVAVAFVTERARVSLNPRQTVSGLPGLCEGLDDDDVQVVVYRHAEIHGPGRTINVLYEGTEDRLGARIALTERPETAGYAEEWNHGLPVLAGRVINDLDDDDTLGVSEFEAIRDLLFALNEAITIASENARLTGQDRIFVAGRMTAVDGAFDASLQVFQVEKDGGVLGENGGLPIMGVEKHYDAEPLWTHIHNLVTTALSRVGLVARFIGTGDAGHAGSRPESGAAIRLQFMPTTNAAKGKAKEWLKTLPKQLSLMLQIVQLPSSEGGFGRPVTSTDPPAVEFGDPLPQDEAEIVTGVATAVQAEVMSRKTGIEMLHPEWDEAQVAEELKAILADQGTAPAPPPPSGDVPEPNVDDPIAA